ncbi:DUF523 domain-containing protein [Pontibacillus salicampi]|uniref:DUF523 domain-containing protein n=1 Tax=Pontibacillus salicampi TaxID=1449801 RepID=A0ABV6LKY2_9BACI
MILISSCLAGQQVRYNETHCLNPRLKQLIEQNMALPVCPELLGGFSIPREPAEIVGGDGGDVLDGTAVVKEKSGQIVTDMYIQGAYKTLEMAKQLQVTTVVLKEYSPSCGSSTIYNGAFSNMKTNGEGVTTTLLRRNGIDVMSEYSFMKELDRVEDI